MSYSFISYTRKDQDFALRLAKDLRGHGINVWLDQLDIPKGDRWDTAIEKALTNCDTLIAILSDNSVGSNNVLDEIYYALGENKRIIPVKISDCKLPFRISRHQYVDFEKDYTEGLNSLVAALQTGKDIIIPDKKKTDTKRKISSKWMYGLIVLPVLILVSFLIFKPGQNKGKKNESTESITGNDDQQDSSGTQSNDPTKKTKVVIEVALAGDSNDVQLEINKGATDIKSYSFKRTSSFTINLEPGLYNLSFTGYATGNIRVDIQGNGIVVSPATPYDIEGGTFTYFSSVTVNE